MKIATVSPNESSSTAGPTIDTMPAYLCRTTGW